MRLIRSPSPMGQAAGVSTLENIFKHHRAPVNQDNVGARQCWARQCRGPLHISTGERGFGSLSEDGENGSVRFPPGRDDPRQRTGQVWGIFCRKPWLHCARIQSSSCPPWPLDRYPPDPAAEHDNAAAPTPRLGTRSTAHFQTISRTLPFAEPGPRQPASYRLDPAHGRIGAEGPYANHPCCGGGGAWCKSAKPRLEPRRQRGVSAEAGCRRRIWVVSEPTLPALCRLWWRRKRRGRQFSRNRPRFPTAPDFPQRF